MTLKSITRLAFMLALMVGSVACSSGRTASSTSRYPGGVNRDGSVAYPDRIPGSSYPGGTSSTSRSAKGLPPGQAKKIYGGKSAKAYAPGQQKKMNNGQGNGKGKGKGKKGKKH